MALPVAGQCLVGFAWRLRERIPGRRPSHHVIFRAQNFSTMAATCWSCCLPAVPSPAEGGTDRRRVSLPLRPIAGSSVVRPVQQLEEALESRLFFPSDADAANAAIGDDEEVEMLPDPVQLVPNEDGHLLKCRRPNIARGSCQSATILGIEENASLWQRNASGHHVDVEMTIYRPTLADDDKEEGCCCDHPMGDWTRNREEVAGATDSANGGSNNCDKSGIANLRVVDLTEFQRQRRSDESAVTTSKPILSSPGNACHLLRSILQCPDPGSSSHCASPWSKRYAKTGPKCTSSTSSCQHRDQIVAVLLLGHPKDESKGDGKWKKI